MQSLSPVPISQAAYQAYGDLICARDDVPFKPANMGTARRFNFLTDVINLRAQAKLNLCVFSCQGFTDWPLKMKLLERHQHSSQVFMPLNESASYLAIVCLGGDQPDLSTLKAFLVKGPQGISYKPGVWHYPLTTVAKPMDFACLVHEDGSQADCHIYDLPQPVLVNAPA